MKFVINFNREIFTVHQYNYSRSSDQQPFPLFSTCFTTRNGQETENNRRTNPRRIGGWMVAADIGRKRRPSVRRMTNQRRSIAGNFIDRASCLRTFTRNERTVEDNDGLCSGRRRVVFWSRQLRHHDDTTRRRRRCVDDG